MYRADITTEMGEPNFYVGLTESTFKGRWADHKSSIRNIQYRTKSKLSAFVWDLKENNVNCTMKWSVLKKCNPYRAGSKHCSLCLWEKYYIIKGDQKMLNHKDELLGKCRHQDKFLLKNYKNRRRVNLKY